MFQIIICPNNSKADMALSFKSETNLDIARKNIHERMKTGVNLLVQSDDAGQTIEIPVEHISYIMIVDIMKQQEFAMYARAMTQPQKPKSPEEEMVA